MFLYDLPLMTFKLFQSHFFASNYSSFSCVKMILPTFSLEFTELARIAQIITFFKEPDAVYKTLAWSKLLHMTHCYLKHALEFEYILSLDLDEVPGFNVDRRPNISEAISSMKAALGNSGYLTTLRGQIVHFVNCKRIPQQGRTLCFSVALSFSLIVLTNFLILINCNISVFPKINVFNGLNLVL